MSTDRPAGDTPPEQQGAQQAPAAGSGHATAAALAAAVRAVESGERSAASFFNDAPRRPATPPTPAAGPAGTAPAARSAQSAPQHPTARPAAAPADQRPTPQPTAPTHPGTGAGTAAAGPAPQPATPVVPAAPAAPTAPGLEGVRQVLAAGGAPETLAEKAAEVLGERAAEALREDPWQLLGVPGVRPEQADGFARALLGAAAGPGDERRAQALVCWLLEQAAVAGHSALEASALRTALAQRSVPDPDDALQNAIADGAVLVFQDAIEEPGGRPRPAQDDDEEAEQPVRIILGLDRFAMAEESVADGLARLLNTFEPATEPTGPSEPDAPNAHGDAGSHTAPDADPDAGSHTDADTAPDADADAGERPTSHAADADGSPTTQATDPAEEPTRGDSAEPPPADGAEPTDEGGAEPADEGGAEPADEVSATSTDEDSAASTSQGGATSTGEDGAAWAPEGEASPLTGPMDRPGPVDHPGPVDRRRPSPAAWEAAAAAAASPSAAELIRAAADSGLVAHTGAEAARAEPAALIAAARSLGLRAYGATHTENGRRRLAAHLTELTATSANSPSLPPSAPASLSGSASPADSASPSAPGEAAVTVSGLLSGRQGPGRDQDGALALDLLVVLDAPQLDLEAAALLVESLSDGTRLVLSGDTGVLWSAGPGRLFADLLAARFCPQVVSRTPDFGPIGELVSGIGIGELSQVEAPGKEVVIVPVRDAREAVHRTVQLVADSVPRALNIPADGTQVITVGHGGAAGTRALNAALKERLNPGPGRFGGFDPGDRVAYTPTPGRTATGTVTGADAAGLHLLCDGAALVVPRDQVAAGTVRHAWALTAHQSAGMRWPAAVVVLPGDAAGGLTRSWVYTAFSRGEQHLSVVQGVDQALPQAVATMPAKPRTTRLRTLLRPETTEGND
ncbi:helix-hairpin-helix domain-containing protein [Streptomyces sp. NPDC020742]|uniref:helix-hairpin-helix domain-containing protein n=1 Tax=Streptomyces sp. NPDC020742 TaxID=3154897 RepID=UPI003406E35C